MKKLLAILLSVGFVKASFAIDSTGVSSAGFTGTTFSADANMSNSVSEIKPEKDKHFNIPSWLEEHQISRDYQEAYFIGRQLTYLYVLDVIGRDEVNSTQAKEIFLMIKQALYSPSALIQLEALYILKHWTFPAKMFYKKIAQLAVFSKNSLVANEALWLLEEHATSVTFPFHVQQILVLALKSNFVGYRKRVFNILSSQKKIDPSVKSKLHVAVEKENYLKQVIELKPEVMQSLKSDLLEESPSFVKHAMAQLSNIDRSNTQVSQFLASLLTKELSSFQFAKLIEVIEALRIFNADTVPPILHFMRYKSMNKLWQILRMLEKTPMSWHAQIFHNIKNIVLYFDTRHQNLAYYVLQKILWYNPQVRKHIRTIFYSNDPTHVDLRNLLFHSASRYRVAGLYLLSELHSVSYDAIKEYLLDSLFDKFPFKNFMSLLAIEQLSFINEDINVQKLLIKKLYDNDSSVFVRSFIIRSLRNKKFTDLSILRNMLHFALFDSSQAVRTHAIYILGDMQHSEHLLEFRHTVVDVLTSLLKNPVLGIIGSTKPDLKINDIFSSRNDTQNTTGTNKVLFIIEWKAIISALGELNVQKPKVWKALAKFLNTSNVTHQKTVLDTLKKLQPTDPEIIKTMQTIEGKKTLNTTSTDNVSNIDSCRTAFN